MRTLRRATMILSVPLFAVLMLANCGDDNNLSVNGGGGAAGHLGVGGSGAGGAAGAGGSVDAGPVDAPVAAATISIQNMTFSPVNLTVSPGATVTVNNIDSMPHSVTSQAGRGQFVAGAVSGISFDTGIIAPGASAMFTIPASAVPGTIIPYFCRVHLSAMANALLNQITIQ